MFTVENINMALHISALIVTCMVLTGVLMDGNIKERIYRSFFAFLLLNLAGILSEFAMAFLLMSGAPPSGAAMKLLDFFSYLISPLQSIAFALYLYEYLGTKTSLSRKPFYLSVLLSVISVLTLVLAQMRGLYGRFLDDYSYVPGEMNAVYYLTSALFTIIFIYIAIRYGKGFSQRERLALLSYPLIILACYAIEGTLATIWISYFGASLVLFIVYINIQGGLKQQLIRKDAELADQRISIMLSQIQPHFLYNALNSIDNLFYVDPENGHEALYTFSDYLRKNMDSLTQKNLIPFMEEMEHTRQYLKLEKLRFKTRLEIDYDIQTENFDIPTLTLQPIVENAVRYGVTKKREGGRILIRTEDAGLFVRITVADDGVGFDPNTPPVDGRSHMGIANVRERLSAMCGGTLTIESVCGKGTTAVMEIPKRTEESL